MVSSAYCVIPHWSERQWAVNRKYLGIKVFNKTQTSGQYRGNHYHIYQYIWLRQFLMLLYLNMVFVFNQLKRERDNRDPTLQRQTLLLLKAAELNSHCSLNSGCTPIGLSRTFIPTFTDSWPGFWKLSFNAAFFMSAFKGLKSLIILKFEVWHSLFLGVPKTLCTSANWLIVTYISRVIMLKEEKTHKRWCSRLIFFYHQTMMMHELQ